MYYYQILRGYKTRGIWADNPREVLETVYDFETRDDAQEHAIATIRKEYKPRDILATYVILYRPTPAPMRGLEDFVTQSIEPKPFSKEYIRQAIDNLNKYW